VRTLRVLVTGIALFCSAAAVAGPFCVVVTGLPPNCRFYDEDSCARAAVASNGGCVTHKFGRLEAAQPVEPRNASYCLVRSGTQQCYFYDAQSCAKAAQEYGGTCITRPKLSRPRPQ
jgi:hypothetical protein